MSISINNLPYETSPDELTGLFSKYGQVKRVNLPTDRETSISRGFGFVEMGTDAEENAAVAALNGTEWKGRTLKVSKARPSSGNSSGRDGFSRPIR